MIAIQGKGTNYVGCEYNISLKNYNKTTSMNSILYKRNKLKQFSFHKIF